MQVTTSVTIMQVLRLYCKYAQVVLSVTVILVDLSVAIMYVTVSVAIIQSDVSAALMQVTVSSSNMWMTILLSLCRWESLVI